MSKSLININSFESLFKDWIEIVWFYVVIFSRTLAVLSYYVLCFSKTNCTNRVKQKKHDEKQIFFIVYGAAVVAACMRSCERLL